MPDAIKKFFGSEEAADELKLLDKELEIAINAIKELKEDWEKKAEHVNNFLKEWDSTANLNQLKQHIRAVEEIEEEEEGIAKTKAVLKLRRIIEALLSRTENEFLRKTAGNLEQSQTLRNRLLRIIDALFNSESENWRKLEEILQKQIDFINTYYHQDIGIVYHNIGEFVGYLKEEGKLLGMEEAFMQKVVSLERFVKNNYLYPRDKPQISKDKYARFSGSYEVAQDALKRKKLDEYLRFLQNYGFDPKKSPRIARLFLNYFNLYRLWEQKAAENELSSNDPIGDALKNFFTITQERYGDVEHFYVPVLSIIGKFEYVKNITDIKNILYELRKNLEGISNIPFKEQLYFYADNLRYKGYRASRENNTFGLQSLYIHFLSAFSNFKSKEEFEEKIVIFNIFFEIYVYTSASHAAHFSDLANATLRIGVQNISYLLWLLKTKAVTFDRKDYSIDWHKVDAVKEFIDAAGIENVNAVVKEMQAIEPEKAFLVLAYGKHMFDLIKERKLSIKEYCDLAMMLFTIWNEPSSHDGTVLGDHYLFSINALKNFIYYYGAERLMELMGRFFGQGQNKKQDRDRLMGFLMAMKITESLCEHLSIDEFEFLIDRYYPALQLLYHYHEKQMHEGPLAKLAGVDVNSASEVKVFYDALKHIYETFLLLSEGDMQLAKKFANSILTQTILGVMKDISDWEVYAGMISDKGLNAIPPYKLKPFMLSYADILSIFIENSRIETMAEIKEKSIFEEIIFWLSNGFYNMPSMSLTVAKFSRVYYTDKEEFEKFKLYFLRWESKIKVGDIERLFNIIHQLKDLWEDDIVKLRRVTWALAAIANTLGIEIAEVIPQFKEVYGTDLKKAILFSKVLKRIVNASGVKTTGYLLSQLVHSKGIMAKNDLEKFARIAEAVKPENVVTIFSNYLPTCMELIETYGLDKIAFDFVVPLVNAQSVTAQFVSGKLSRLKELEGLKSFEDALLFLHIGQKYPIKALDIYEYILIEGIREGIISKDLSSESDIIKSFLQNAPAYILELYRAYKEIWLSDKTDKRALISNLFKDVFEIKEQLYKGIADYGKNEKLFFGVLYHVFPAELSVTRSEYEKILKGREDRQSDIPKALDRLQYISASVSKGAHVLKSNETLETEAWSDLINAANTEDRMLPAETIGINLLRDFVSGNISKNRRAHLNQIVLFSKSRGETLPAFSQEHNVLMKYKEFIGDRMNDLLFLILSETQTKNPQEYFELASKVKQAKADLKGLSKTIAGLWNSRIPTREARVRAILERNSLQLEQIAWGTPVTPKEVEDSLMQNKEGVIEKSLISKIKQALYGEEYSKMQREMQKFEFRREGRTRFGELNKFIFTLSKRKAHSIAMFNMGVCVAVDDKLWNQPDMWQLIIFDQDKNACGGAIYRTIEEQGKKYLVISIQPNSNILSASSPEGVYSKIIQYSKAMQRLLYYDALLIPVSSGIHSNRGSIQTEISKRNYRKITLKKSYDFSYSPYGYRYNEFYLV